MTWQRMLPAVVAAVILSSIWAAPAAAAPGRNERDYLALGDSVAFGFNPLLSRSDADNFVGYPDVVARILRLDVTNASCPGETSSGFISLTGVDNGCRPYRAAFPLHVDYKTAQLDYAVGFLEAHPRTKLVTLDIGANDLFVLQKQCGGNTACIQAGLPSLLDTLSANLNTIYGRVRNEAHFHHKLVGLTYYSTNYADPVGVAIINAVNARVAQATLAAHGRVADGFDAFRVVAQFAGGNTCKAGLLIVTSDNPLTCDIHPSALGRDVLATAVVAAADADGADD